MRRMKKLPRRRKLNKRLKMLPWKLLRRLHKLKCSLLQMLPQLTSMLVSWNQTFKPNFRLGLIAVLQKLIFLALLVVMMPWPKLAQLILLLLLLLQRLLLKAVPMPKPSLLRC